MREGKRQRQRQRQRRGNAMHDKGTTTSRPQRGKGKGMLGSVKGSVHAIRRSREALLLTELTERKKGT